MLFVAFRARPNGGWRFTTPAIDSLMCKLSDAILKKILIMGKVRRRVGVTKVGR